MWRLRYATWQVLCDTLKSPWTLASLIVIVCMCFNFYVGGWWGGLAYAEYFTLGPLSFFISALQLVVLCPVVEEYLFRGQLIKLLRHRQWANWSIYLVVTLVFAGAHVFAGGWGLVAHLLPLSAMLTLLRLYSKDIGPSLVAHMGYNAMVLLMGGWAVVQVLLP